MKQGTHPLDFKAVANDSKAAVDDVPTSLPTVAWTLLLLVGLELFRRPTTFHQPPLNKQDNDCSIATAPTTELIIEDHGGVIKVVVDAQLEKFGDVMELGMSILKRGLLVRIPTSGEDSEVTGSLTKETSMSVEAALTFSMTSRKDDTASSSTLSHTGATYPSAVSVCRSRLQGH